MKISTKNFILLISAILFITTSCSVEKRLYTPGYHLSWHTKNYKKPKIAEDLSSNNDKTNQTIVADINKLEEEQEIQTAENNHIASNNDKNLDISLKKEVKTVKFSKENLEKLEKEITNHINKEIPNDNPRPRTNVLALLGFIFGILGLLIAGIIFGLAALILSIIGMVQIGKHEHFKGNGFAIAGLILGVIDIVLTIILIAAIL